MPDIWEGREYKTIDEDSVIWIVVISDNLGVVVVAGFLWDFFWEQHLCQQSYGLTITETVGALQGTVLQDHNFGGYHLCRNSTFTTCRSSYPTFPDFTTSPGLSRFFMEMHQHKLTSYDFVSQIVDRHTFWTPVYEEPKNPEEYIYPTPSTPITFTNCTFKDLKDETENSELAGGGALHLFTTSPLLVKGCTFTNCVTMKGSGGAIFVQDDYVHSPDQIRIESSTFKHCSSPSGDGGGICVRPEVTLELVSSTFENCSALTGSGGAVCTRYCAVSHSTFKDNKAQTGGGLACSYGLTLHFSHFQGNEATSDPDFEGTFGSDQLFPSFGISFSDPHWTAHSDVLFVRTDGTDTAPCTLIEPCSLLSTAVSLALVEGSAEVMVGTGSFGSATISETQTLILNGFFAETDIHVTHPTTSFSIEVKDESSLTIDTITLFPLEGQLLVSIPSDSESVYVSLERIHLSGSGITAVPFDFQAGTVRIEKSCFGHLSDIHCSLITVAGSTFLTISACVFMDIDITASVIDVNGGFLEVESTHFRRITRTEGKGSAAIDALNPQYLTIFAPFSHCHFSRGRLVLSTSTARNDQPQIINDIDIEISSQRIEYLVAVEDEVMTDLVDSSETSFSLSIATSAQCVLTFSPSHVQRGENSINSNEYEIRPILTQSNKTDETLFRITSQNGDDTYLTIDSVRILLNTQHTAPMITVDAQSSFKLEYSVVSSDGGVSQRPFIRSEGCIAFESVLFIDMSFDGCSCIETTGGTMMFDGAHSFGKSGVHSLSTNVDGAFLNAVSTNVTCATAAFVDCHARNGGVIYTKDCEYEYYSGFFIDCSAEEQGGGFCSESDGSVSQQADFTSVAPFVNCHAKSGGGFFLTITPMMNVMIGSNQAFQFLGQFVSFSLYEGCSAEKGAGGYLDGEIGPSTQPFIQSHESVNDGVLCKGSEYFISKSLAESIIEIDHLPSDYFQTYGSLSSRSESDDGPYKHVEVEGYPQHSFNFDLPNIVVENSREFSFLGCLGESFTSGCNSLSHLIDRFHTQTDNGRFLQIPIKLKDKLFLFETARVTKQSIKLLLNDEGYPPPERTKIVFGDKPKEDTKVFVVVDTSGSVELSELNVDWDEYLSLCQLVDSTASMSILGSDIKIASALSFPLIECQAGTLVISTSSFSSSTSDTFTRPLVLSEMSASFASNSAQSEMIVELSGVGFKDLTIKDTVGAVELNDADHIKLSNVDFDNVILSNDSEALRIVVTGRELWKTIERVPNSGFTKRGTPEIDILYQSLDRNEEGRPFHTPTLLVYLSQYTAPLIHVQSNGKDVLGCGDPVLSCHSLDEADGHLEVGFPSVISVHDSAQLSSQLDFVQDQTKISAKGTSCSIKVAADGSLINHKTGSFDHILELVHLSFVLSSGRSKALLQSTSGMLIVTDCSFSWNSELTSELALISGGRMRLIDVNMTRVESSLPLFRFVGDESTQPSGSIENCHFSSSSSTPMRSTNNKQNDSAICWWNLSLIVVSKSTLDVSLSSFSDLANGGIVVVNGTVSVYETRFEKSKKEGSGRVDRFGSLNRNILCSEGSLIHLKSTTLETALSTSLWINADSSCVVRDSTDVEISNPFFVPSLAASSCSASFDKKSSEYSVIVVGKELIPCGLSLIVRENTTSGTPSSVPFGLDRLEFVDETNVSISISKSELSALDSKLGWIGLIGFGVDGESNTFTFKVDAKQARAELMSKTLPWLIPLIVVVVVAIIVLIILVVLCRRRRLAQKEPQATEMKDDTLHVEEEKMEENEGTHDGLRPQHILTTGRNAVEVENNTAKADAVPESLPTILNVVEALRCQGKIEMTVVRDVDTLYNALHGREKKKSIVKRVIERQIASGMAKIGEHTSTATILTKLSSHWVMFDAHGNVCLKLQEPTPSIPQPQPHTPQPSQTSQSGTGDLSNSQENQRWKAPEVVKAEEAKESQKEINPLKAAVFSLGLVLWEIETGTVPFAEMDAVNAQRQMGTGTLPKMSGIGSEMRELIEQCLSLNPDDRPTLSTVSSVLDSIEEEQEPPPIELQAPKC
ncbi:hypothetical protein BLNAU_19983 [Blattamonas nauphoetae]|uniref:Protein kinase domain-containing protein n=1 Tax=Blattamonas nauphoetae TaxID=2049346 RepID=A0ABQ9X441_9EUKA|nr:hypothetical protein BLNAU_19983 [Blattamonas nauphoetae]